jgi:hypothetical protein
VKCYKCGKAGHKAFQCPDIYSGSTKQGEGKTKFKGTCNQCGKVGHKKADCWDLEANKDKRPKNWKVKTGETGAAGVEIGSVETLLGAVDMCFDCSTDEGAVLSEIAGATVAAVGIAFPDDIAMLSDRNIWIGDTGASSHSTFDSTGLIDVKQASDQDQVTVGNGEQMKSTAVGDLPVVICDRFGREVEAAVIKDVSVIPNASFNMFSVSKAVKDGWLLTGDADQGLVLTKGTTRVCFDIKIHTKRGVLYCVCMKREANVDEVAAGAAVGAKTKAIQIKTAHDQLGHCDEESVRAVARQFGWTIARGSLAPCRDCAAGKARQANVPKVSVHVPSKEVNGRIFLDVSSIKNTKEFQVTNRHWLIMVDEHTRMKFSSFHSTKNGIVEYVCEQFKKWQQADLRVQVVRCDNGGENKALEQRAQSADWQLGLQFEFTGRNTPQQNSLAEVAFATLANRGRAMMHRANLPLRLRYLLFKEVLKTATLLDGLIVTSISGETRTRYEHWCGKLPKFAKCLRTFGEAGTVTLKMQGMSKLQDRGVQCMFVGYSLKHEGNCFRMWDPVTKRVHVTRDVLWLRRMFYPRGPELGPEEAVMPSVCLPIDDGAEAGKSDEPVSASAGNDPLGTLLGDEEEASLQETQEADDPATREHQAAAETADEETEQQLETGEQLDEEETRREATQQVRTSSGRTVRAPSRLIAEIGALSREEERLYEAFDALGFEKAEIACVGAGIGGGFQDTSELRVMKYKEAMASNNRAQWIKAVEEELQRMRKHNVWTPYKLRELPRNVKLLDTTWAMKKKSNGTYRARLNARGFKQVDGEHFDGASISSPVTNDTTIRIAFVLMIMMQGNGKLCDVKGAFLHGEFEDNEVIYIHVPEGFEKHYQKGEVLRLNKTIYGLKQSAAAFWRELLKAMQSMGYSRSAADPCLYYKWIDGKLNIWLSWIDDCLNVGDPDQVQIAVQDLMKLFDCEELGQLNEYVGCRIHHDAEESKMKITQPVLIQSFEAEFDLPSGVGTDYNTPAEPGQILEVEGLEGLLSQREQTVFRSGVGKLLYLARWSRPDIQNAVRELSRCGGKANAAHMKAMKRLMKYCVKTKDRGWVLKPSRRWDGRKGFKFRVSGHSDSNYAACKETRKSVSGFFVSLEDVPILAKSVGQKIVTLSVTEAELYAAVLCVQEMLYVKKVLESMGLEVELPMVIHLDNRGAVDLANGWSIAGRTRHIDTRQWFLRELKAEGILKIEWVKGEENPADLFTKNLPGKDYERHAKIFCGD